jgi:riboflavin synthase
MFTGIIESVGRVVSVTSSGANQIFEIKSSISDELKTDQSLSHNGVCLTVTKVEGGCHFVTAVAETLIKSNLGNLAPGDPINLEQALLSNGRFDGHIVQGHVDQTAICTNITEADGSWVIDFEYEDTSESLVVEKGSITVDGISLTCYNVSKTGFTVAIIPYTFENTNFGKLKENDMVNIEFDIIGKYVKQLVSV